jgi:hypothetical protein
MKSNGIDLGIAVAFLMILGLLTASMKAEAREVYEATGTSTMKEKSLTNALVAAHFQCNRKRLWADLNTLSIVETSTSSYKISGGRKRITEYHTTVIFECGAGYQKSIEDVS